jgi:adenosine deaminase
MNLTDLHRHLDGSIRLSTLTEFAHALGKQVPADLRFFPGMGLNAALSRFAFTLSTLQTPEAVERVASEISEDAIAEGITTLEIRFAPQLHQGANIDTIVDAALSGIGDHARLNLCGLYGEPPDLLMHLVEIASTRPRVVGLDLAGGPAPGHRWGLTDYNKAFTAAKQAGLGRTVHAGEGRPASEIRAAIEHLHAQRIGHGLSVLDDPSVADLVREKKVTLEACPTSNWHVGAIERIVDHPIAKWIDAGLLVCVNTDNTLLSDTSLPQEIQHVSQIPGITARHMGALQKMAKAAQFSGR